MNDIENNAYTLLSIAIVKRACIDYINCKERISNCHAEMKLLKLKKELDELVGWFLSPDFDAICTIDGGRVLDMVEKAISEGKTIKWDSKCQD